MRLKQSYSEKEQATDLISLRRSIVDHLELKLRNLARTFAELRSNRLPEIAHIISAAPRVWFLGFGAEDGTACIGESIFRACDTTCIALPCCQLGYAQYPRDGGTDAPADGNCLGRAECHGRQTAHGTLDAIVEEPDLLE